MKSIKEAVKGAPLVGSLIKSAWHLFCECRVWLKQARLLNKVEPARPHVFYIGIAVHPNLGDLAQTVCIRKWLSKHFPEAQVVEVETNALVNTHFSLLKKLKAKFSAGDIVVFNSGFTTTDLGGYADEMHRKVMELLPNAPMLMMPQTIFFKSDENKARTSRAYNSAKRLLFLARDKVSYSYALQMFPDIPVKLFPDIVATLIGSYYFSCQHRGGGVIFCCRDDVEQYYSREEMGALMQKCRQLGTVEQTDTTKRIPLRLLLKKTQYYIEKEIERYARFKVVITDRFHGTIFALAANTPVIVLRTTDHKVIMGAEWFKEIYPDYIYVAGSLDEAFEIAVSIYQKDFTYRLQPYFEREYYDHLPRIMQDVWRG